MRFDVVTLFPELFAPHLVHGVTRRAFESRQVDVRLWPLRDFGDGPHARVDDRPYGGGPGMVMLAEPLARAVRAIRADRGDPGNGSERDTGGAGGVPVVSFAPSGEPLRQSTVERLAADPRGAILVCGRYEGIDQRFVDAFVTLELSLGDYVLSGGEIPALALLDAVARLQPGVLGDARSSVDESFAGDGRLVEGPHYSRPESWHDGRTARAVPPVLLSGDHAAIERWRREQSVASTRRRRPDLLAPPEEPPSL